MNFYSFRIIIHTTLIKLAPQNAYPAERHLELKSVQYRQALFRLIMRTGAGHIGGDLSCLDFLNVLYNRVLRVPSLELAETRKGKGVSFMENVARWHHGVPNDDEFSRAMAELEAAEAAMA
jgi:transketolase